MEKAVKEENISALKLDLAKAQSLILADFRGISVKSDTTLRREFRMNGCRYQVVKNTLLAISFASIALIGTWGSVQWLPLWADQLTGGTMQAAKAKKRVAVIEDYERVGGGCVGRGLDRSHKRDPRHELPPSLVRILASRAD